MTLKKHHVNKWKKERKKERPFKMPELFSSGSFSYLRQKQWPILVPSGPRGTPQQETHLSSLKMKKKKRRKKAPRNFIFVIKWGRLFCDLLIPLSSWREDKKLLKNLSKPLFHCCTGDHVLQLHWQSVQGKKESSSYHVLDGMLFSEGRDSTGFQPKNTDPDFLLSK